MKNTAESYKISLSGNVTIKDRVISEELARQIINLVMTGKIPEMGSGTGSSSAGSSTADEKTAKADGATPTAKAFMAQKKPTSEVERMTCLAYYLSKYRNTQVFKTKEATKLNTEAAQPPFSNAAVFIRNADRCGYLAKAGGGSKQISVLGEAVVEALPDRDKVKAAIEANRTPSKKSQKRRTKKAKG